MTMLMVGLLASHIIPQVIQSPADPWHLIIRTETLILVMDELTSIARASAAAPSAPMSLYCQSIDDVAAGWSPRIPVPPPPQVIVCQPIHGASSSAPQHRSM